jgi:hypothetical protein
MDLGKARSILGVKVMHDYKMGMLYLHQASKIMEYFSMADMKAIGTPMDPGLVLPKLTCMSPIHLKLPYHLVVGQLSYLSQATYPDITFPVNVLSQMSTDTIIPTGAQSSTYFGIETPARTS